MTIENNIWMISISDNEISQYWKSQVQPSWEEQGYTVHHFEAVTPDTVDNYPELRFARKPSNKEFTPTEKAVWCSHYQLWIKCVYESKPIVIVEHDVMLHSPLPKDFKLPINFFSHTYVPKAKEYRVLPAGGYYLTPAGARRLIERAKRRAINMNVDGYIYQEGKEIGSDFFGKFIVAEQLFDPQIGTTIDHGK